MDFDPFELGFIRILRGLDRDAILQFLDKCKAVDVPAGTTMVVQGEEDDAMLILLEGALEVFVGTPPTDTLLRRVRRGEHLGELALLGLAPVRTASIRATVNSAILVLERMGYDDLVAAHHPAANRLQLQVLHTLAERIRETNRRIAVISVGSEITPEQPGGLWDRLSTAVAGTGPRGRAPAAVDVLRASPHFKDLPRSLCDLLSQHIEAVPLQQGEHLLEEGSMRGDAWILATGEVGVYRVTPNKLYQRVGTLKPGALFGHLAIINSDTRTATCVTEQGSWLYRMPREVVHVLLNSATPEGQALRRSFILALAGQLQQANARLSELSQRQTGSQHPLHPPQGPGP